MSERKVEPAEVFIKTIVNRDLASTFSQKQLSSALDWFVKLPPEKQRRLSDGLGGSDMRLGLATMIRSRFPDQRKGPREKGSAFDAATKMVDALGSASFGTKELEDLGPGSPNMFGGL